MNWFTRFLLVVLFITLLLVDVYAIAWITMGGAWVEGFMSAYFLPTHQTMSPYQGLFVIIYITLLSMACLVALLKSIRFENLVYCKPVRGGDSILLTDKAIKKTIYRVVSRMPQVARVMQIQVYNSFGAIKVKIYVSVWMGESIPEMRDEAERRTKEVFDKILGVRNLAKPKIITKGLKEGKASKKKLAKVMGDDVKKSKSESIFPPMENIEDKNDDMLMPDADSEIKNV